MIKPHIIKKWNEEFEALSKPDQRVAIAKDVLLQLRKGIIIAEQGTYVSFEDLKDKDGRDLDCSRKDVQKNFDLLKGCNTCALGAVLVSCTKFTNKLKFVEMDNFSDAKKKLKKFFTFKQLALMEHAFEGFDEYESSAFHNNGHGSQITEKDGERCKEFHDRYGTAEDRMKAIMRNVIRNKGTFII